MKNIKVTRFNRVKINSLESTQNEESIAHSDNRRTHVASAKLDNRQKTSKKEVNVDS